MTKEKEINTILSNIIENQKVLRRVINRIESKIEDIYAFVSHLDVEIDKDGNILHFVWAGPHAIIGAPERPLWLYPDWLKDIVKEMRALEDDGK